MMSEQETEPTDDDIVEDDESIVDDIVEDMHDLESYEEDELEPQPTLSDEADEEEFALESSMSDKDEDGFASQSDTIDVYGDEEEESLTPLATADELDIDAALAAVSQLTLLVQQEPDEDGDDFVDDDDEVVSEDAIQEFSREPQSDVRFEFEQPRELSMVRGQMASVIPALSLIILGGWLTFALTTSTIQPTAGLVFGVVLVAVGAVFLSQWLTSARWSRGNFFFGSSALLIGGIHLYFSQVSPDAVSNSWSLWIVALGIALFGAGYVAVPRLPRLGIMGFLTIITGAIGYILTSGTLDPSVIQFISNLWFVGVAIIIFMMIAPLIRRRQ